MAELISHRDQVANLLADYRTKDPKFVQIVESMMNDLHQAIVTINPIKEIVNKNQVYGEGYLESIDAVTVTIHPFNIELKWAAAHNALFYEIRTGSAWDTSTFVLKTSSLGASLNPLDVGTHDYWIDSVSASGDYGSFPCHFQIVISALGSLTVQAVSTGNGVLLSWTTPSSGFKLSHYNLYKDGTKFAEIYGTNSLKVEGLPGSFTYEVEAVDIQGNVSSKYNAAISFVSNPLIVCYVGRSATATFTQGNTYYVAFDVDRTDPYDFHNPSTNNDRITIPTGQGGVYIVGGHVKLSSTGDMGNASIRAELNGNVSLHFGDQDVYGAGTSCNLSFCGLVNVSPADYIRLQVYAGGSGTATVTRESGFSPYFFAVRIAAA